MHKYIFNFEQLFNYHVMDLFDEGVMYIWDGGFTMYVTHKIHLEI